MAPQLGGKNVHFVKFKEQTLLLAVSRLWGMRLWPRSATGKWWSSSLVPRVSAGTMAVWPARRQSSSCSPARRPASWSGTASRTAASTLSPSSESNTKIQLRWKRVETQLFCSHYGVNWFKNHKLIELWLQDKGGLFEERPTEMFFALKKNLLKCWTLNQFTHENCPRQVNSVPLFQFSVGVG